MSEVSGFIRNFGLWINIYITLLISGCATTAEINNRFASENGMQRFEYNVAFPHVLYQKSGQPDTNWHIYIEGDGRPWLDGNRVAADPTTIKPLMLRLMAQDSSPSVYLGRPCYNLLEVASKCHPYFWTHGRYSEPVIASLTAALEKLVSVNQVSHMTLIGHSGGGTLAMLLAERIPEVITVVTLAGNLDIEAWAVTHGYSKMHGSLNPAVRAPLPTRITQQHYLGLQDQTIKPSMINPVVEKQGNTQLILLEN